MTVPAESVGWTARLVAFAPVRVEANPAPSALSVAPVQTTLAPVDMLIVALLT